MTRINKDEARKHEWLRSRLLRALVSAAVLALLLLTVNLRQLVDTLSQVAIGLLLLATAIFLISNMASVFKWRLIVRAQQDSASCYYLTTLFYIGLFFNNFLPSNVGGDVVKAYKLGQATGRPAEAAGSVVMDRASSTFALLFIAAVLAIFQLKLLGTKVALLILLMLVFSLALIIFFASERAARVLGSVPFFRINPFGLRRHFKDFYYSLHGFKKQKPVLTAVMFVSLIYQSLNILTIYILALSLGIDIPILYYFLFIPIVLAVAMMPISLNGLGVREGAWVLLFGQVGVPAARALSMSVLSFLVITVVSLAGGFLYLFGRAPARAQSEAGNG